MREEISLPLIKFSVAFYNYWLFSLLGGRVCGPPGHDFECLFPD